MPIVDHERRNLTFMLARPSTSLVAHSPVGLQASWKDPKKEVLVLQPVHDAFRNRPTFRSEIDFATTRSSRSGFGTSSAHYIALKKRHRRF